jgi:autotransporter-associated beta strand protein/T5SS/PEP-CTERM-associated repeat protein
MTLGQVNYSNPGERRITGTGTLTLQTGSGNALYQKSGNGFLDIDGPNLVLNSTTEFRITGIYMDLYSIVSGSGGIVKTGYSGLVLDRSNNSYSGINTINEGYLSGIAIADSGNNSSFGKGNFEIDFGATLEYTGTTASTDRTITLGSGGGVVNVTTAGQTLTWNGVISGSGDLAKGGTSTWLELTAANTYSGSTTINDNGGLRVSGGNDRLPTGTALIINGATFAMNNVNQTVGSLAGSTTAAVTLGGGTLTTGGDNTSTTFSGVIFGTGTLTKQGTGTMTLSGSNTYSGLTTINGGTLSGNTIANNGSNSSFGRGNFAFSGADGTMQYTGPTASTNRTVSISSGSTGAIDVSNSATELTISGLISGTSAQALNKTGPGGLYLTNNGNGWSGTNTFSGGWVQGDSISDVANQSAFGRGNFVLNGAELIYGGASASTNRFFSLDAGGGTITVLSPTATLTLTRTAASGPINGVGSFTKSGPGRLRLNTAATYAGSTTISQGELQITANERLPDTTAVNIAAGANLHLNNFNETIGSLAGSGNVTLGSGVLTTGGNGDSTTFSGAISGTGQVRKIGGGTFALTGTNSYRISQVDAGTLSVPAGASVSNDSAVIGQMLGSNGVLTVVGNWTNSSYFEVGAGGSGSLNITAGGSVTSGSGVIGSEAGSSGTMAVGGGTGTSTWTSSGILDVGHFGAGTLDVTGGGSVSNSYGCIGCYSGSSGAVTVGGGTGSSTWTNSSELLVGNESNGSLSVTGGGSVSNTIGFIGYGPGISGAATVGGGMGTSIWTSSGPLAVGYFGTATLSIMGGGNVSNTIAVIGNSSGSNGVVTVGGGTGTAIWTNFGLIYVGNGGSGTLNINSGGIVSSRGLAGGNAASSVKFNGGTLAIVADNTASNTINLLSGGGTLHIPDPGDLISFTGSIGGAGALTKTGSGSLELISSNTYSGGTTINGGSLLANNAFGSATGSGAVTVGSGGALGGSGTIGGSVTNAGLLAPGSSAGTLNISGNYIQSAGGKLQIELASATAFDRLDVTGTVSLAGALQVSLLSGYQPLAGSNFDILDFTSLTGSFGSFLLPPLPAAVRWNTSQLYSLGRISVTLSGDLNGDFVVNAADYVIWRKGIPDTYTQTDYNNWRSQFGQSIAGSALQIDIADSIASVPEPRAALMLPLGLTIALLGCGRCIRFSVTGARDTLATQEARRHFQSAVSIILFASMPATLLAATWTAVSPGDLLDGANWSGGVAPNGIGHVAEFTTQPTIVGNFALDGPMTLGTLNYWNSSGRDLDGSGTLTFQVNSGNALVQFAPGVLLVPRVPSLVLASTTEFHFDFNGMNLPASVSGSGGVIKTGSGFLQFENPSNSYTGSNDIQGGTLAGISIANSGINSAFGRGNFAISNAATLQYSGPTASSNRSIALGAGGGQIAITSAQSVLTLSGAINGSGGLVKSGPGHIVLSGENSYAGGTTINGGTILVANISGSATGPGDITINAGRLNIGVGESSGSILGNIINNGFVDFYRSDDTQYSGKISGTGYIYKEGSGTLTLTNKHTYQGNTYIFGGTLKVGAHERLPSTTPVFNDGTLDLNDRLQTIGSLSGSGNVMLGGGVLTTGGNGRSTEFTGAISGSGIVVKEGTGTFTLSGINAYTGGSIINRGTVLFNGVSLGGPVWALYNSTLGGNGFIGTPAYGSNLIIESNLAPGNNAPGTLTLSGDIIFQPGSNYQVEIAQRTTGAYDQLIVNKTLEPNSGKANLGGIVQVALLNSFTPVIGDSFQILFAAGGLSGKFSSLSVPAVSNVRWELEYSGNSVFLNAVATVPGDFNGDLVVDAADYVWWRKYDSSPQSYDAWRTHFGNSIGNGLSADSAVPEPSTMWLLAAAVLALPNRRRA